MIGPVEVVGLFVLQLLFIGSRTVNVSAISHKNTTKAILSGMAVHWTWLMGIYYGVASVGEIIHAIQMDTTTFWPWLALVASTTGGLVGTYLGIKK